MKNKTYVLKNAVILDGTENMQPITGKKLLIENGIIADILPDDADTGSAEVIDLNGKYLMPGLINLHVHLPGSGMPKHTKKQNAESVRRLMSFAPSRAVVYSLCRGFAKTELLSGVTTIRTVGGILDFDSQLRDLINGGHQIGPRILAGNMAISVPGGHMAGSLAYAVTSPEEAQQRVKDIAATKADLIKLMITGGVLDAVKKGEPGVLKMDPAIIRAACDQAHALGLKVAAHVESPEGVKAALENGVDTIEHGAKPDAEMLELFRTHGASLVTTISPTLSFALFDQSVSHATDMQKYNGRIVMDGIVGCAKACLDAGIPVGLGTDTACPYVTQYGTWRELTYLRRFCGVSNTQALHIATLASARIAGVEKETGSIEAGKSADMLVCRENPLNNLAALRQLSSVIFRGKCYTPKVKPIPQVEQELDNYL